MPITTEDEPEDIDDDAPARVRLPVQTCLSLLKAYPPTLPCASSTPLPPLFRQLKFFQLFVPKSISTSRPRRARIADVPCSHCEYPLRVAASISHHAWTTYLRCSWLAST